MKRIVLLLALFVSAAIANEPAQWRYTLENPSEGWEKPEFDDDQWEKGPGGFGTYNTPGVKVQTEWKTKDIWLRRTVEFMKPPANPTLLVFHDEDAEIYLNGTRVAAFKGFATEYRTVRVAGTPVTAGKNVLAVHCRQSTGGQGIDVHLAGAAEIGRIAAGANPLPKVTMRTPWADKVDPAKVWTEYPRPQLRRDNWTILNGQWDYAITSKETMTPPKKWDGKILVPFAVEAPLSGVEKRFTPGDALWYNRKFTTTTTSGMNRLLHFEAVDYESTVWVNGKKAGSNTGGNLPFSFDITDLLQDGENTIIVRVTDATDSAYQLHGKQRLNPKGIWYTPVSGIWQTVWMEEVPTYRISDLKIDTKMDGTVTVKVQTEGTRVNKSSIRGSYSLITDGKSSGNATQIKEAGTVAEDGVIRFEIKDPKLWSPESPHLYRLNLSIDGVAPEALDSVESYFGIRETGKVKGDDGHWRLTLNGEVLFHWGTLDQGWWPDGLLTPPSNEAMVSDIQFLKDAGFNTIRKHIKVEPRRYYYHCDKIGMMLWQDQVSAMADNPEWTRLKPNPQTVTWPDEAHAQFMKELEQMMTMLHNHPSIVQWVPFNERWGQHQTVEVGKWTSAFDPTRQVNIASGGNFFPAGDIVDAHKYPHPDFPFDEDGGRFDGFIQVIGEFGGHGFPVEGHLWSKSTRNWGYGGLPKDKAEWLERYATSIEMLAALQEKGIAAGIYTQTTDVEGEINGLITYDRKVQKITPANLEEISKQLFR